MVLPLLLGATLGEWLLGGAAIGGAAYVAGKGIGSGVSEVSSGLKSIIPYAVLAIVLIFIAKRYVK